MAKTKSGVHSTSFDLIIVGGGPAGYTAAIKGSLQGFKTAIIEKTRIGGACINRGCIPTKALWGTAKEFHRIRNLRHHGIIVPKKIPFKFPKAVQRQFKIIDQMVKQIRERMQKLGVTIISSEVENISKKSENQFLVHTKNGTYQSKFILIATGSSPATTDILTPDGKNIVTTDEIVLFKKLPKVLCIAGGGVVACEFASIFNAFGVKVHLFEHSTQVLSAMDQEVVSMLMDTFRKNGIRIHTNTTVQHVDKKGQKLKITLRTKEKSGHKLTHVSADHLLLAIGRKPNSQGLGLEKLGVKFKEKGFISVNGQLQTDCRGIFAAGDVIGGQMLAHKAWYDASIAIRAMSGEECRANYNTVPGAIFTVPEMASVGLQPEQARQKGMNVAIGKFLYQENSQAMCVDETEGIVKAVVDRDSEKVVGCTLFGHDASNLISEVALAMQCGLKARDIANTIHPHPTLSEMIWESFLDTQGLSVHKS
ncbi:MAG: dihydrolipoyl dehydrogenase [Bacteriovoracia bacterium]